MARCVKVDDHEDYHHHCYGDYYVSVSVDPFEHVHSSLPFLKGSLVLEFFGSKITAVSGALPCDKLGQSNFQIRTKASELRTVSSSSSTRSPMPAEPSLRVGTPPLWRVLPSHGRASTLDHLDERMA